MSTSPHPLGVTCKAVGQPRPRALTGATRPISVETLTRWLPLIVLPIGSIAILSQAPPWLLMWGVLASIVAGCKWLTWCGVPASERQRQFWRTLGYLAAWPGMDATRFFDHDLKPDRPHPVEWLMATVKFAFGTPLVGSVAHIAAQNEGLTSHQLVVGWVALVGLAFMLHFGLFHLLSLLYRSVAVHAPHIFRWPVSARSVTDFWGSRWNLAFRDLAHRFAFQPLAPRIGPLKASLVTFVLSGLIHELVISVPAGAGYGLPTLYFLLQWVGLAFERSALGARLRLRRGLTGRLFAWIVVAVPAGVLFHPAFVTRVICPFLCAIGGLAV